MIASKVTWKFKELGTSFWKCYSCDDNNGTIFFPAEKGYQEFKKPPQWNLNFSYYREYLKKLYKIERKN